MDSKFLNTSLCSVYDKAYFFREFQSVRDSLSPSGAVFSIGEASHLVGSLEGFNPATGFPTATFFQPQGPPTATTRFALLLPSFKDETFFG